MAIASVAVGIPLILVKGAVSLRHLVLDINILMTVAVAGALQPGQLSASTSPESASHDHGL